jgi:hypothetical protein
VRIKEIERNERDVENSEREDPTFHHFTCHLI